MARVTDESVREWTCPGRVGMPSSDDVENMARDLLEARRERDEARRSVEVQREAVAFAEETEQELALLKEDIADHLPAYLLGDTDDEANERETVEYAGAQIKLLERKLDEAREELRLTQMKLRIERERHSADMAKSHVETFERTKERDAARAECSKLHEQLREGCTCGSGGHPRHCKRHPGAYEAHAELLNAETALDEARAECASLQAKVERLRDFARSCRDNYDCDDDAHKHGTMCRCCEARDALIFAATPTKVG